MPHSGKCRVGPPSAALIIGALRSKWSVMAFVLGVLTLFSTITVIHRIRYTYQITKSMTSS